MTARIRQYSRRSVLGLIAGVTAGLGTPARAGATPALGVFRDPNCGCCIGWVAHLRRHGFRAHVTDTAEMSAIKVRLGVPSALASCHTAQLGAYVIEGHVPAHAIKRLLAEKPDALGLAVPGMPIGSPGMEGGAPETYDVILFASSGQSRFGRYLGDRPI
ncbi:MAG: DUF411 domain-containing protein [Hyphomicrobiaceae bacterium]